MAKKESKEMTTPERKGTVAPFEEMEQWFENFFRRPFFGSPWLPRLRFPEQEEVFPAVDIFENEKEVVIKAEIPGVDKKDLDVNVSEDTVTISGEKRSEEKVERKDFYRLERSFGSFTRKLRLPAATQTDKAKATFKDGTLEVRIPKVEAGKEKAKKVTVE